MSLSAGTAEKYQAAYQLEEEDELPASFVCVGCGRCLLELSNDKLSRRMCSGSNDGRFMIRNCEVLDPHFWLCFSRLPEQ